MPDPINVAEARRLVEASEGSTIFLPNAPLTNLISWYLDYGPALLSAHEAALARIEELEAGR